MCAGTYRWQTPWHRSTVSSVSIVHPTSDFEILRRRNTLPWHFRIMHTQIRYNLATAIISAIYNTFCNRRRCPVALTGKPVARFTQHPTAITTINSVEPDHRSSRPRTHSLSPYRSSPQVISRWTRTHICLMLLRSLVIGQLVLPSPNAWSVFTPAGSP